MKPRSLWLIARSVLIEAVMRELGSWPGLSRTSSEPHDESVLKLRHVLALLALATRFEAVEMASSALESGDVHLRGTALEYLENVLPASVRAQLFDRIGAPSGEPRVARSRTELVEELNRSFAGLSVPSDTLPPGARDEEEEGS